MLKGTDFWANFWYDVGSSILPLVTYFAGGISQHILQKLKENKYRRRHAPIIVGHRADIEISLILDRLLYQLPGAIRCYLVQYHNGDHFYNELEIVRKTRTHERVKPGISYQSDLLQSVLVSNMPEETKLVLQPGPSFTHVSEIAGSRFAWLCEQGGVVSLARCAIRSKNNLLVGFVGADFDVIDEPPNIADLCAGAYRIGQILTNK